MAMAIEESTTDAATVDGVEIQSIGQLYPTSYKPRTLKVSEWTRPVPCFTRRSARPCPFLIVRGRWLELAGFDVGRRVSIDVQRGRLVVELLQDHDKEEPDDVQKAPSGRKPQPSNQPHV